VGSSQSGRDLFIFPHEISVERVALWSGVRLAAMVLGNEDRMPLRDHLQVCREQDMAEMGIANGIPQVTEAKQEV
jgi:hypothetical protein